MINLSFYFCILSLFSLHFSRSISFDFSQIEYAHKATKQGKSVIAIKRSNDIIVSIIKEIPHNNTTDNDLNCLHPSCHIISDDIYLFATGFIPDIEYIYEVASDLAFQHKSIFKTNIPINRLVSMVASEIHRATIRKSSRPFAVNLLFLSNNTQTNNLEIIEIDTLGSTNDCTMACLGEIILIYRFFLPNSLFFLCFLNRKMVN